MNRRKLAQGFARIALLGLAGVLSACATAPAARQEISILDAIDNQRSSVGPASCAALSMAAVCEKSTRLGKSRNCGCADPHAVADGVAFRL